MIKAQPRQGWAEAAKRAHENGDDELLIPDVFEDNTIVKIDSQTQYLTESLR